MPADNLAFNMEDNPFSTVDFIENIWTILQKIRGQKFEELKDVDVHAGLKDKEECYPISLRQLYCKVIIKGYR